MHHAPVARPVPSTSQSQSGLRRSPLRIPHSHTRTLARSHRPTPAAHRSRSTGSNSPTRRRTAASASSSPTTTRSSAAPSPTRGRSTPRSRCRCRCPSSSSFPPPTDQCLHLSSRLSSHFSSHLTSPAERDQLHPRVRLRLRLLAPRRRARYATALLQPEPALDPHSSPLFCRYLPCARLSAPRRPQHDRRRAFLGPRAAVRRRRHCRLADVLLGGAERLVHRQAVDVHGRLLRLQLGSALRDAAGVPPDLHARAPLAQRPAGDYAPHPPSNMALPTPRTQTNTTNTPRSHATQTRNPGPHTLPPSLSHRARR